MTKCPICGKHGFSNESYADICHCERKDYIKEIERLKGILEGMGYFK